MSSQPAPLRKLLATGLVSTGRARWARSVAQLGGSLRWDLEELAGRVVELSGPRGDARDGCGATAARTAAVLLVRDAQRRREPVAWLAPQGSTFFPPDVAAHGVDLAALAIVRVGEPVQAWRAADELLRSGAFGLVVLEAGAAGSERGAPREAGGTPPMAVQVRLANLARQHDAVLVWFGSDPDRSAPRAGARGVAAGIVTASLRVEASRHRAAPGAWVCRLRATKDKRRGRGWTLELACDGPPGLR
ncbi:MAG: recombinase A [Planctomycetes bacterium]|nr:recombinase A [Planctomycetota bacterium]